jgi:gas vesicle protein GvpA/GvpJ/GvpM family
MEPQRESQATLEDLVERVLDKGIVLKLDLIVGVAGIPLIGISLQAAIAAIETMLEYGMMEAWDADTRKSANREAERHLLALQPGEHVLLDLYGSHHHTRGISRVWRPGRLILTSQRLFLVRLVPWEVLFEARVSEIAGIGRVAHESVGGGQREIICLALADGTLAALYTPQPGSLEAGLREEFRRLGQTVAEISGAHIGRLDPGAVADGQLWHRWEPGDGPALWKSGWAMLTETELTWRPDMVQQELLRVPLTQIWGLAIERRELGILGVRDVLVVTYGAGGHRAEALFAGERIGAWPAAIRRAALGGDGDGDARP